ncbi:hypothetical protein [Legionella cardiaca]|uniref:Uncharacterized protein n=1 Tax=Legionella cardiaca TaxID=1071983 RepID=A0ABY8ANV9_9GAMM|nr:hypothetical protein [Legionella cardiaca]WED42149.1 hypothetical protein PXX05_09430 [Legionella cardiaca]
MKIVNPNGQVDFVYLEFILKSYIQKYIDAVPSKYTYVNETGVNPAFQAIEEIKTPLDIHEKRLFVLRSDLLFVTGIKNAYQEYGYQGLKNAFDDKNHQFINWDDRYGHPSLAIPHHLYDGGVLYAGFICQRFTYLEVFLSSGRFNRYERTAENTAPLLTEQQLIVESYLSLKLRQTYGKQAVHFYDTFPGKQDDDDSALFFSDTPFPKSKICRIYNEKLIIKAGQNALKHLHYADAEHYIAKNIPPIKPKYSYDDEGNINPGFQNIQQVNFPLQPLEKRIWVLRTDFILALGVKNAYQKEYGYYGLEDSFSKSVHPFLNWKDRSGHPSLALVEKDYDGSVFYAGYLCQREKFLQVYLVSGRFDRSDLNKEQTQILEAYIAAQLQVAYGKQPIVFDYGNPEDPEYHKIFFANGLFAPSNPRRIYSSESINLILGDIQPPQSNLSYEEVVCSGSIPKCEFY